VRYLTIYNDINSYTLSRDPKAIKRIRIFPTRVSNDSFFISSTCVGTELEDSVNFLTFPVAFELLRRYRRYDLCVQQQFSSYETDSHGSRAVYNLFCFPHGSVHIFCQLILCYCVTFYSLYSYWDP